MLFALDAMGGDYAPAEPCKGAILACNDNPELEVALVGLEEQIKPYLDAADGSTLSRIHVVPASEVIGMGDNPAASIRTKKNSSMRIAMEMVRSKEAVGCISAGKHGGHRLGRGSRRRTHTRYRQAGTRGPSSLPRTGISSPGRRGDGSMQGLKPVSVCSYGVDLHELSFGNRRSKRVFALQRFGGYQRRRGLFRSQRDAAEECAEFQWLY